MIRASQINDDVVFAWDAALLHPLQELIAGDGGRGGAGGGKRCVPGLRHVIFLSFFFFSLLYSYFIVLFVVDGWVVGVIGVWGFQRKSRGDRWWGWISWFYTVTGGLWVTAEEDTMMRE